MRILFRAIRIFLPEVQVVDSEPVVQDDMPDTVEQDPVDNKPIAKIPHEQIHRNYPNICFQLIAYLFIL